MNKFSIKPTVYFGKNSLEALEKIDAERAVLFTDAFMKKSGNADKVSSLMKNCGKVSVYSDIVPDPPVELIASALGFLLNENAEVVVALGGGSVIDAAKATILMYTQKTGKSLPLIAVPTTSGTGSEVTKFAVITDKAAGVKYPLVTDSLLPDAAILSDELTASVPANITADTGFDVITHALEAYISINANDFTDAFAEKALELAFEYLPRACKNGSDLEAREKMHTASCLAGMAFNDASLGVNHGIAHALGAVFHIPHGRANAMVLCHVMKYNAGLDAFSSGSSVTCERLAKIARFVGLPSFSARQGAQNLIETLRRMSRELGIPQTLADVHISEKDYMAQKAHIVKSAVNDACTGTNPRKIDEAAVESILKGIEKF
ncbi:MAG: iron-containing alcohol dehydrogenase [Clostridiales bacterium]|nr:iron-containing alcohol dehydrogenase [Clostridiales bacterium]